MLRALITGADGFIGSHLTEMLMGKGYKIKALAQYNSYNNWGWLEEISNKDKIEIITGDIRDRNICSRITKDVDIVFHLAALIAIPYSYAAPESYIATNIQGTMNLCQASLENGVKKFIHTSTSEVYGTAQYVPIDEKHPKSPQSPYSASKIGADAIALSFYHSFNLPVTIARPFNTYGPRQSARAFIPSVICQILAGMKRIEVGDLSPTRDLNYVKDTCKGLLLISQTNELIGKEVNVCSNSEISMRDVLKKIQLILESDCEILSTVERKRPDNSEVFRLFGDNSLIKQYTGYSQNYSIDEGIKETCNWLMKKNNLKKYKAHIFNV